MFTEQRNRFNLHYPEKLSHHDEYEVILTSFMFTNENIVFDGIGLEKRGLIDNGVIGIQQNFQIHC